MSFIQRHRTWLAVVLLVLLGILAFALRCLHLLEAGHCYIISADSYYFHRIAELIASGQSYYYPTQTRVLPYLLGSGLAYPLGLTATFVTLVSGATASDALDCVGKLLPPAISVANMLLLYVIASRMYGRRAGLLSAFAWATTSTAIFMGAAGYLDRDGVSMLLITTAVASFFLMRDVHLVQRRLDLTWLVQAGLILLFAALLYLEWGMFIGPVILLAVLGGFVACQVLTALWKLTSPALYGEGDIMTLPIAIAGKAIRSLPSAIGRSDYRPFVLALCIAAVAGAVEPGWDVLYRYGVATVQSSAAGSQTIAEMRGTSLADVLLYGALIPPIVVGVVVATRRQGDADALWLGWAAVLFITGLFAKRLFFYVVPAGSVLAGVGFAAMLSDLPKHAGLSHLAMSLSLWDMRSVLKYARAFLALALIAVGIRASVSFSYQLGRASMLSVQPEWNEALTWLREETSEESVVMTRWDFGYWIFDVAHRVPVVDNGVHPEQRDKDVALAYCTTSDAEAVALMNRYGATYLVFSTSDVLVLPHLSKACLGNAYGDGRDVPIELKDSLYARAIRGQTDFGRGLTRVYPENPDSKDMAVVILAVHS